MPVLDMAKVSYLGNRCQKESFFVLDLKKIVTDI